jgi:hypothetical protein
MPRTKKKQTEQPAPPPAVNGPATGEVLTLAEAAALLRVSEQAVIGAVTWQGLSGRMIGGEWRFTKGGHPAMARPQKTDRRRDADGGRGS